MSRNHKLYLGPNEVLNVPWDWPVVIVYEYVDAHLSWCRSRNLELWVDFHLHVGEVDSAIPGWPFPEKVHYYFFKSDQNATAFRLTFL